MKQNSNFWSCFLWFSLDPSISRSIEEDQSILSSQTKLESSTQAWHPGALYRQLGGHPSLNSISILMREKCIRFFAQQCVLSIGRHVPPQAIGRPISKKLCSTYINRSSHVNPDSMQYCFGNIFETNINFNWDFERYHSRVEMRNGNNKKTLPPISSIIKFSFNQL